MLTPTPARRSRNRYNTLVADPIFLRTVVNTLVFLAVAINIKMALALLLSGFFLSHFWLQLWNSFFISVVAGALTLLVATFAAFAISRLRVPGGRFVMNLALFTYLIPAAFLAVPMYRTMGMYGLLNNQWSLILAMVTLASPYAIWVLKQASDKLPYELDEAAIVDGASLMQLFRLVYVPLMMPSLVAVGTYALILARGTNICMRSFCCRATPRSRYRLRSATSSPRTTLPGSC